MTVGLPHLPEFPSVELTLAYSPEELAPHVLRLANRLLHNELIHDETLIRYVSDAPPGSPQIPQPQRKEVYRAVAEAVQWLRVHIMLMPEPGTNGNNGHMVITRRGRELAADEKKLTAYRRGVSFPKSLLHASIADKAWLNLARGEFDDAVFGAFKRVEEAVREAAGYGSGDHGVAMFRRAFNPKNGPLTDQADEEGERDAMMHLFAGAYGSCKNPRSHRSTQLDAGEAQEMVLLACYLLRIVDARVAARAALLAAG